MGDRGRGFLVLPVFILYATIINQIIMGFKQRKVKINSVILGFEESGRGAPVVFLHGWGTLASSSFHPLLRALESYCRQHSCQNMHLLNIDLPGFGSSSTPHGVWGLQQYADVIHKLLKYLRLPKAIIVSHSFGGQVSLELARTHPSSVKALVLISPAAIREKGLRSRFFQFVSSSVGSVLSKNSWARRRIGRLLGSRDYKQASAQMKKIMKKVLSQDLREEVREIALPCLLLWGLQDRITPPRQGYELYLRLPHSRMITINEARHSPHITHPSQVIKHVVDFINEHS